MYVCMYVCKVHISKEGRPELTRKPFLQTVSALKVRLNDHTESGRTPRMIDLLYAFFKSYCDLVCKYFLC